MKSFIKYAVAVIIAAMLVCGTFAAEGDYGYYDRNYDGDISTVDVIMIVRDLVNNKEDGSLLKAIKALKISTSAEKIVLSVKAFDYKNQTATLFFNESDVTMPFSTLGIDKLEFAELYEEGFITLTVPASVKNYTERLTQNNVYAVKFDYRYDTTVLSAIVGNAVATLDGTAITISEPFVENGTLLMDASVFNSYFEADIDEAGYISVKDVADSLDIKLAFDEESGNITLIRQFYPTLVLDTVSAGAGDTVTVNMIVKHNPAFAGLECRINYNSNAMSYVSGKSGTNSFYSAFSLTEGANPVKAVFANLSLKNVSGDFALASFTFKVSDNAAVGEYNLTLSAVDCYDKDIIKLKTSMQSGKIVIE